VIGRIPSKGPLQSAIRAGKMGQEGMIAGISVGVIAGVICCACIICFDICKTFMSPSHIPLQTQAYEAAKKTFSKGAASSV
jgi:hypothetical protein